MLTDTGFLIAALVALPLAVACVALLLRQRRNQAHVAQLRDREERFKMALWATGERYWDIHLPTRQLVRLLFAQEAGGQSREVSSTTRDIADVIHGDDLPRVEELMRAYVDGATAEFVSEHRVRSDGPGDDWVWVRARGRAVEHDAGGAIVRVAGTALNISKSRDVERERQIASEVLRSMNEAVTVLAATSTSSRSIRLHPHHRLPGRRRRRPWRDLLESMQHYPAFYRHIRSLGPRRPLFRRDVARRRDGEEFLCAIEAATVLGSEADGERLYVFVLNDITLQKRAEQELRYLANFDTLTNLPNRSLLSERLSRAIVRARRESSRIAVLFLDLDRFKDINDSLGHAAENRSCARPRRACSNRRPAPHRGAPAAG